MSYFICDGCDKKHHIFRQGGGVRIAAENGVAFLGEVPMDIALVNATDKGIPVATSNPDSPGAVAMRSVAGALASQISIFHEKNKDALLHFSLEWK